MFLHVLFSLIDIVTNLAYLRTICIVQTPAHSIVTLPTKRNGKYNATTQCIFEVEINEIINIQSPQLIMLLTAHLKEKTEPEKVPFTFINVLHNTVQIAKNTVNQSSSVTC